MISILEGNTSSLSHEYQFPYKDSAYFNFSPDPGQNIIFQGVHRFTSNHMNEAPLQMKHSDMFVVYDVCSRSSISQDSKPVDNKTPPARERVAGKAAAADPRAVPAAADRPRTRRARLNLRKTK